MRGVVAAFDSDRGFGNVRADSGEEWFFHCTAIADGTRTIAVGAAVSFTVVPGRRGRYEATAVAPVTDGSPPGH